MWAVHAGRSRTMTMLVPALAVAGCSSSSDSGVASAPDLAKVLASTAAPTTPADNITADPVSPAAATPTAAASTPADSLTGYGATSEAWDAAHTASTSGSIPGAAYDDDPSLGDGNHYDQRYYAVLRSNGGRVTGYTRRQQKGLSLAAAVSQILAEDFPGDARVVWQRVHPMCAQAFVLSPSVRQATRADGDGGVLVELDTEDLGTGQSYYNPSNVDEAHLSSLPASTTPADAPNC